MDMLLTILVYALVFALFGGAVLWLCRYFKAPDFVYWIVGAILMILLLTFAFRVAGAPMPQIHPLR